MTVVITRSTAGSAKEFDRVIRRLKTGARPLKPVVEHFARELKRSIKADFEVGGRSPFQWKPNTRNVMAVKGHSKILKGRTWKLRDSIKVTARVIEGSGRRSRYFVNVRVPQIGAYHQSGYDPGPGAMTYPTKKKVLVFQVAEDEGAFRARRNKAMKRRRDGETTKTGKSIRIPSRPGAVWIAVTKAKRVGYPARKIVVVREGLIREAWRIPLRRYLFEGRMPK